MNPTVIFEILRKIRASIQQVFFLFLSLFLVLGAGTTSAASSPTIQLFPTNVVESIKQTGSAAKEMEDGIISVIEKLDQQQQLYRASSCDRADSDPGCGEIMKQMSLAYGEMLDAMEEKLPVMEKAVERTRDGLQKRIASQLGGRSTTDIQELLLGNGKAAEVKRTLSRSRRTGVRLSERFKRYYKLVANSGAGSTKGGDAGIALMAANMYLDMEDSANFIALTRQEIQRSRLINQLEQSFSHMTPEMEQTIASVKGILFGEGGDELEGAAPAPTPAPVIAAKDPMEL